MSWKNTIFALLVGLIGYMICLLQPAIIIVLQFLLEYGPLLSPFYIYILVASCYIISGALSHYGWHWHGVSIAHSGHSIFYVRLSAIQRLFSSIYIFMGNHWMHYLVCRYGRDPQASLLIVQKDNAQKIPFITFTHLLGPLFFLHRAVFILMIYNRPRVQTPSGIFTLHQQQYH